MMAPALIRGFNDAYGSWKTICTRLRYGRNCDRDSAVTSTPSSSTCPPVGSIRRMMALAAVDLPQPDSPTMPMVSPWPSTNEMPSTARTSCRSPKGLRLSGKYFFRSLTSSSGAADIRRPRS